MIALVIGLVVFLVPHSLGVFAPQWRETQIARIGLHRWKLVYSAASIVGLAMVIWGYGLARTDPTLLWAAPEWVGHLTELLAVVAFILVVGAYVPGTHFKSALGHPMTAGIGVWAFGHLLANGTLRDVILFGAFLAWSIVVFVTRRRRDREAGAVYPAGHLRGDIVASVVGLVAALVFALFLHAPLIGVRPFG